MEMHSKMHNESDESKTCAQGYENNGDGDCGDGGDCGDDLLQTKLMPRKEEDLRQLNVMRELNGKMFTSCEVLVAIKHAPRSCRRPHVTTRLLPGTTRLLHAVHKLGQFKKLLHVHSLGYLR